MLTGRRAFKGDDISDTLAAVLRQDVDWTALPAPGTARDRWDKARIVVQSITSGEPKTLIEGGSDARYVPTGHLVYALSGIVYAVAFDVKRLEVYGRRVPVIQGVRRSTGGTTGAASFSFSSNGSLTYIPGPLSATLSQLALANRQGGVELLKLPPGDYLMPRVSPDGTRIAFGIDDGKEAIVYTYELSNETMQRLTFGGNNRFPIWSGDSKRVAFQSDRDGDLGIFWQAAIGGKAERLTKADQGTSHAPESWSPKGDTFLYSVTKESDVSLRRVTGDRGTPWDGRGHGLTPDKSQMLPFTFCMGSTSLPLATPISALPILGSMRQSGELKCVT